MAKPTQLPLAKESHPQLWQNDHFSPFLNTPQETEKDDLMADIQNSAEGRKAKHATNFYKICAVSLV